MKETNCKCKIYHALQTPCDCVPPYVVLLAFGAWLTQRQESITLSAKHSAAIMIELIEKFCKAQGWMLNMPTHEVHKWMFRIQPVQE